MATLKMLPQGYHVLKWQQVLTKYYLSQHCIFYVLNLNARWFTEKGLTPLCSLDCKFNVLTTTKTPPPQFKCKIHLGNLSTLGTEKYIGDKLEGW